MPKYKIEQVQVHKVYLVYSEEFDTSDPEKWGELKAKAHYWALGDFEKLPVGPPKELMAWLDVYEHMDRDEFEYSFEDWNDDNAGTYSIMWRITDENGEIVYEK